jgi:hypothetical protein
MIMESVGGSLRAESALGQGTVMTVSLPVVSESAEAKPICHSPLERGEVCSEACLGSGTPRRMSVRPVHEDRIADAT